MSEVTSITVTTGPTVEFCGHYLKASASVTLRPDPDEDLDEVKILAVEMARDFYLEALLSEITTIRAINKQTSLAKLVGWLKRAINVKDDAE